MRLCALGVKSSVERDWLLCISKSFGRKDVTFSNANRVFFRLGRNKTILFYGEKFIWSFEIREKN